MFFPFFFFFQLHISFCVLSDAKIIIVEHN